MKAIKLIISDLEGCITPNKGIPFDFDALCEMAKYNQKALEDNKPPLTICSGRPQPYVEAIIRIIQGSMPAICENGAVIYIPTTDKTLIHPAIGFKVMKAMEKVKRILTKEIQNKTLEAQIEPGKTVCISLNPIGCSNEGLPNKVKELYHIVSLKLANIENLNITHSASAVDITPNGIDKFMGLKFLSEITNILSEEMIGIGDSVGDISFLKEVAIPCCPNNSSPEVKNIASYISPYNNGKGVLDIIRKFTNVEIYEIS